MNVWIPRGKGDGWDELGDWNLHIYITVFKIHTEKTRIERDMYTPMFTTALFIIARTWKQPRCPSGDEWIRKLWYIYTMEYYSAIKRIHLNQF